jgi:hypothetical protein
MIAGGRIEGGQTPSQAANIQSIQYPTSITEPVMEDLLPPEHIEISEYDYIDQPQAEVHPAQTALVADPEPLLNYTEPVQPTPPPEYVATPQQGKGVNPANTAFFSRA